MTPPVPYRKYNLYRTYHGGVAYEVPVTRARAEFADLVNRVVYGGERVVVTRHGKPIVAMVSAADLDRLDQLDQAEELDRAEPGTVVRLTSSPVDPASPRPASPGRLDIAARHRPPGGGGARS
jgi:prevent-host-death family protein